MVRNLSWAFGFAFLSLPRTKVTYKIQPLKEKQSTSSLLVWMFLHVSTFKAPFLGQICITDLWKANQPYHPKDSSLSLTLNITTVMPFQMRVQRTLLRLKQSFLHVQVFCWVEQRAGVCTSSMTLPKAEGKIRINPRSYFSTIRWVTYSKYEEQRFLSPVSTNKVLKHF